MILFFGFSLVFFIGVSLRFDFFCVLFLSLGETSLYFFMFFGKFIVLILKLDFITFLAYI